MCDDVKLTTRNFVKVDFLSMYKREESERLYRIIVVHLPNGSIQSKAV